MGELSLIKKFRSGAPNHPWMLVGPGQDCAVLRWPGDRDVAYKIDQVIEGTHFVLDGAEAATPREVGWKAMAKACSDVAATGFWPVAATVAVNLRKGSDESLALGVYEGLCDCCKRFGFALAGGDLATSENGLAITVSLLGEGPAGGAWTRAGGRPGDALLVTGTLGQSRQTRKHLTFTPRLEVARAIRKLAGANIHACIDITDGLSRDLQHLCSESNCGAVLLEDSIPCTSAARHAVNINSALGDGEDFELLIALDQNAADQLLAQWVESTPLTRVGSLSERSEGLLLVGPSGRRPLPDLGYEHRT